MSSAIHLNLDQSKILSSGNELNAIVNLRNDKCCRKNCRKQNMTIHYHSVQDYKIIENTKLKEFADDSIFSHTILTFDTRD